MNFSEALAQEMTPKPAQCKVTKILDAMSPEDADAVRAALADENVITTSILRALNATGWPIAFSTLTRHRRGGCACE